MLEFLKGKASSSRSSISGMVNQKELGKPEAESKVAVPILFSTFLFWSPLNIISLCLLKSSFSLNLAFLFPSGLL